MVPSHKAHTTWSMLRLLACPLPASCCDAANIVPSRKTSPQAREEMEFAGESKDTTYFDEEAAAAKEAVDGEREHADFTTCCDS